VTAWFADAARERLLALFITGNAGNTLDGPLALGMGVLGKPFALDALAARARMMLEGRG
jgi:DNA-binding response OmpR family regulator